MADHAKYDSDRETDSFKSPEPRPVDPGLPLPPSKRPPKDFADYQFLELLGKGAFGQVFKVWSERTCRYEAMKVIHQEGDPQAEQLEAFKHEVQRMANVHSAHIVPVYHADVMPDGRPFFTMEYLSGGRLDHYCDRSRRSLEDRIRAVAEICDAVHEMHELNLVHCDIKPGNIVVTEDAGVMLPKLVDFGLANHRAFRSSPSRMVRGTLPYMAPEQLECHGGDPAKHWDIYALGVTLYQLVVGECPIEEFPDPSLPVEVLADHVRKTPIPPLLSKLTLIGAERSDELAQQRRLDATALRKRLGNPWLEAVIDKALAKDPDQRYASAGEMAGNLRQYVSGKRPAIVKPTMSNRVGDFVAARRSVLAVLILLIVIAALTVSQRTARIAARDATVTSLFAQACAATEPSMVIETYQRAIDLDPSRSDIRLHLAGAFLVSGDAQQAIDTAKLIGEEDSLYNHAQALIHGMNQFRTVGESESVLKSAKFGPAPGDEYYYSLLLGPDEAEHAIFLLTRALEDTTLTHEQRFRMRLMRAMRYFQICDFDSLTAESKWLVETVPDSAAAWNVRGLAYWNSGYNSEALSSYNKALKINSDYAAVYANRAYVYNKLQRYDQALRDCDRAVGLRPALERRVQSARILAWTGKGDTVASRAECERISSEPDVTSVARRACVSFWGSLEMWERVWIESDRGIQAAIPSNACDEELRYRQLWWRGIAATQLRRYADAIHDFNDAETLQPNRWRGDLSKYLARGTLYLLANQAERAVSDLREAARLMKTDPQRALVYLMIWDALLSCGLTAEAEAALRLARTATEQDQRLARIVGHCFAEVDQKTVLADASDDPRQQVEAYYYLGLAAKARGDVVEAAGHFTRCARLPANGAPEHQLAETQLAGLLSRNDE